MTKLTLGTAAGQVVVQYVSCADCGGTFVAQQGSRIKFCILCGNQRMAEGAAGEASSQGDLVQCPKGHTEPPKNDGCKYCLMIPGWRSESKEELIADLIKWHDAFYREENRANILNYKLIQAESGSASTAGPRPRCPKCQGTWIRQESCSECDGDGCAKYAPEDVQLDVEELAKAAHDDYRLKHPEMRIVPWADTSEGARQVGRERIESVLALLRRVSGKGALNVTLYPQPISVTSGHELLPSPAPVPTTPVPRLDLDLELARKIKLIGERYNWDLSANR